MRSNLDGSEIETLVDTSNGGPPPGANPATMTFRSEPSTFTERIWPPPLASRKNKQPRAHPSCRVHLLPWELVLCSWFSFDIGRFDPPTRARNPRQEVGSPPPRTFSYRMSGLDAKKYRLKCASEAYGEGARRGMRFGRSLFRQCGEVLSTDDRGFFGL